MTPLSSVELLLRWRDQADEQAMAEFWNRHHPRVTGLLHRRMSPMLRRRLDADDLAQSVFGTFCARLRDGRIEVEAGRPPWRLLATIALRKLFRRIEFEKAARRSLDGEESLGGELDRSALPRADHLDPDPGDLLAAEEEMERLLATFLPLHRRIIASSLEGKSAEAIALETERTARTVRNVLHDFDEALERRCLQLATC